jgi:D-alanyl-lipoteichoic acid acyltransferase DltB (MBOAT superfamily)
MAIADNLAPFVNAVYSDPLKQTPLHVAMTIFFFSIQIYADFYGYSLIARGAAKLMGIDLMENFRTPYLAKNIEEFWKRWHISLSSWFRDYLYIPLGGNKVKAFRWTINILIVFMISGLWHGPRWTFVIWGLMHGFLYLVERAGNKLMKIDLQKSNVFIDTFRRLRTFLLVTIAWIFFRSESLEKVNDIFLALFQNQTISDKLKMDYKIWGLLAMFVVFDILFFNKKVESWFGARPMAIRWSIYALLIFAVLSLGGVENMPFIYFQF